MSQAQIVTIPDANFKNALVNTLCVGTDGNGSVDSDADTNDDGGIQVSEAEAVVFRLRVKNNNISSLEGIQSFTNLEELQCAANQLTSLNVSQNTNLEVLTCSINELSSLDLTQNTNLERLDCRSNQLSNLDVTQNPNLELFECDNNQLNRLNVKNGNNHNMLTMLAHDNPNLTCIQVDDVNYANSQTCGQSSWCKDNWVQYSEDCSLGSEDFNKLSFALYPNPTQDVLNIDSQEPVDSVRIYSINGSLIKETNPSISVSELSKGLYFAQINVGGNTITKKFIKP